MNALAEKKKKIDMLLRPALARSSSNASVSFSKNKKNKKKNQFKLFYIDPDYRPLNTTSRMIKCIQDEN